MLAAKDHAGFLRAFPRGTPMTMVPVPGHADVPPAELATFALAHGMPAETAPDLAAALTAVTSPSRVLICGSLHLAGDVLRLNGPLPS
jgi:dihydrofolate synthase/folylpolyglutamate synthase